MVDAAQKACRAGLEHSAALVDRLMEEGLPGEISKAILDGASKSLDEAEHRAEHALRAALEERARAVVDREAVQAAAQIVADDESAIVIRLAAHLGERALLQHVANAVRGVAHRQGGEWRAELRAGVLVERENELVAAAMAEFEAKQAREIAEREAREAQEESAKWTAYEEKSEAERALMIFEWAEKAKAIKEGRVETPQEDLAEQEERRRKKEAQEETDRAAYASAVTEAHQNAVQTISDEAAQSWVPKLARLVTVGQRTWMNERLSDGRLTQEAASLAVQCVNAYEADGDAKRALEVLAGDVIGKATRDLPGAIAEWVGDQTA